MKNSLSLAVMALSATGACLVPIFGLLFQLQPQVMHGLHVRTSGAAGNCYIVGVMYAAVFLMCALITRNCLCTKQEEPQCTGNERYNLPFVELESKEFSRAMDAMDRNDDCRT